LSRDVHMQEGVMGTMQGRAVRGPRYVANVGLQQATVSCHHGLTCQA
jgi:hypothetical protein